VQPSVYASPAVITVIYGVHHTSNSISSCKIILIPYTFFTSMVKHLSIESKLHQHHIIC